jgi:23S rRNA pseudouridine2605 synthase
MNRTSHGAGHGLARTLSKLGICSRTQAAELITAGRVAVNGKIERNSERRTDPRSDEIAIDGACIVAPEHVYLALNKPRGLIVSTADEKGRDTIYSLLHEAPAAWLAPVGRLDKASEGLLLLTNDPEWAARITEAQSAVEKTYHVQIGGVPDQKMLDQIKLGIFDEGEHLRAIDVRRVREGGKNSWLEITLNEGRNRHIRRLLSAFGYDVLRLVRVSIGSIRLGDLPKGKWRRLTDEEIRAPRAQDEVTG